MTAIERIRALRLLKKQEKNPDYLKQLGVQVYMISKTAKGKEK